MAMFKTERWLANGFLEVGKLSKIVLVLIAQECVDCGLQVCRDLLETIRRGKGSAVTAWGGFNFGIH